jgi:hypothetical protein
LCLCTSYVLAQISTIQRLKKGEDLVVTGFSGSVALPVRCDSAGNTYLRFNDPTPFQAPVFKLSRKGEKKAVFSLVDANAWEKAQCYDFAVGLGGEVFLLASRLGKDRRIESAILVFSENGTFRESIPISIENFSVDQLAAFSTGEFLVMGWKRPEPGAMPATSGSPEQDLVEAMVFVMDRSGRQVREINLTTIPATDKSRSKPGRELARSAISLARTAAGNDGTLYLLLRTEPAVILAVPPRAAWLRSIPLEPPAPEHHATDVRFATGYGLLVQFAKRLSEGRYDTANALFSIIDPQTGEHLYEYQSSSEVGGAFACFTGREFTFLTAKGSELTLRTARP